MNSGHMTSGSVTKQIFLFSLPLMLGNFLQQLYNTVDGIVVGNFVSEQALAAVGTCSPLAFFFISAALGLSTGSAVMISQYIGAGRMEDVRKSISTCLILITALGLALTIIGGAVSKPILKYILAVPDGTLEDATVYFTIYCLGLVFQFAYNIVAAILRSVGDSKATLYFLLVASVVNIVLDLVFVIVLHWDVAGVAIATVIAQAVCAVISFVYMFMKYPYMRFSRSEFRIDREKGLLALKLGIPTTIQQCIVSMGHIFSQRLINDFGQSMIAGITAAMRIEGYIVIPIFSYNAGIATFTGQNIGAGNMERVRQGYKATLKLAVITCVLVITVALFGAGYLVSIFNLSGDAYEYGVTYLRFVAPFFFIFAIYQATSAMLQGAGDVFWCMMYSAISLAVRLTFSYSLAYTTPLSYRAIWVCIPIGWIVALAMALFRLKRGKWKQKAVVKSGGEAFEPKEPSPEAQ